MTRLLIGAILLVSGHLDASLCAQETGDTAGSAVVKERNEVSQSGITWKFDHPVKSGQFVNGDWWVIGPVTVVSVTPQPAEGPLPGEVTFQDAVKEQVKDIKGYMNFVLGFVPPQLITNATDKRMRNGSMVITKFGPAQGYDSRSTAYDPGCSIAFPCKLDSDRTLISTISAAMPIAESFCHPINWRSEKQQRTLLKVAAVLTCLASEPPPDAFRPPYAGTDKTIYRTSDLQWGLLLNLKLKDMEGYFQQPWLNAADPTCEVATWQDFEEYFQPVWLYHFSGIDFAQALSYMPPAENQPTSDTACFGREDTRLVSIASLMVHLDVPRERKKKLLIGLVQRGIDLSGAFKAGMEAGPDRCEWIQSGCKWPILFASLMLNRPELRQLPEALPFYEDIATYYGTGWFGQAALWRIVWHDHLIDSCEERAPEQRVGNDGISENYRSYGSSGKAWLGTALSARLMGAVQLWGHDAFFDYCDRWLEEDEAYTLARGTHKRADCEIKTWDPLVDAMWRTYRQSTSAQKMSGVNSKAAWERKPDGWHLRWEPNPKPDPKDLAEHVAEIHRTYPQAYP